MTIGLLSNQDAFANGGWWHDSRILEATGEGIDKEEPRAWEGWWNEKVVELVKLSIRQKDALCVLLTGRSESGFGALVKRIAASKGLDFDMVSLKPAVGPNNERFNSTMHFKQVFLRNLMETYKAAEEIRVYEDRVKHVRDFRDYFQEYNKRLKVAGVGAARSPILAEVIEVADMSTNLDPVVEIAEVQKLINDHNQTVSTRTKAREKLMMKKTVFFTGYMIDQADTKRLLTLAQIPPGVPAQDLKYHANNIMICPRPCPPSILEKVGGMGGKMKWVVTGTACHENSIWAACLRPVPATAKFHTDNPIPLVVLALRKGAKPIDAAKIKNWQPVPPDKAFEFETTVNEKVLLRIEPEDPSENAYQSLFPNKTSKRKFAGEDFQNDRGGGHFNQRREHFNNQHNNANNNHNHNHGGGKGRSAFGQFRGDGGGGGGGSRGGHGPKGGRGGPRGRGGRGGRGNHYRSLDDVGTRDFSGSSRPSGGASGGGGSENLQNYY
jgi:hypothetical protein